MCQKWFMNFLAEDLARTVEVDSDQTGTLIENNQSYTMQEIVDIPKISKSGVKNHLHSLAMLISVMFRFCISEENLLAIFLHAILYLNVTKMFCFKNRL